MEYKEGWNPEDIIHSICAFANDYHKADRRMQYWIRPASLTTAAKKDEIAELFDKFNSVPFDDRVNRNATIDMIRRGYLEDFLRESNSSLANELNSHSLEDLLLATEVANITDSGIDIRNIGVLMFTERPDRIIPGAQIDLVKFNTEDAEVSDDFIEKSNRTYLETGKRCFGLY